MPEETSFLTKVVEGLAGELDTKRKTVKDGIPLGKKSVTRQKAKNDLQAMSPEERKKFVDDNGLDEVMRIIGDDLPPIPEQAPNASTLPLNIG
jgi:hypothetical protein|tara:strand:+ start:35 stop:313 length:279 start_codon:yes stop_codon:yes gene_type:complete